MMGNVNEGGFWGEVWGTEGSILLHPGLALPEVVLEFFKGVVDPHVAA